VSHPIRATVVVVVSMISGLAVAAAVSVVELATGFPLFGFSLLFVVPVRALSSGAAVAAGLFAASRFLHVRPDRRLLLVPLLAAVGSFLASHWFTFSGHEFSAGRTFADVMSFADYLRAVTTQSGLSLGPTASVERLGSLGYLVVIMEIVGSASGGWLAIAALRARLWCEESGHFMRRVERRTQRFENQTPFHQAMATVHRLADEGTLAAMTEALPERRARPNETDNGHFALTVDHYRCPACDHERAVVTTHERRTYSWHQTTHGMLRSRTGDDRPPIVSSG
jgi:hypothetical protein